MCCYLNTYKNITSAFFVFLFQISLGLFTSLFACLFLCLNVVFITYDKISSDYRLVNYIYKLIKAKPVIESDS